MTSDPFLEEDFRVLTPETFDFVLTNELKRAVRSQNFVTLVLVEPTPPAASACRSARCCARSPGWSAASCARPTCCRRPPTASVSMVLLDADLQNSTRVIERVMARLEHYQFTAPVDIEVGAACCPTHGADVETLRRVAAEARTGSSAPRRPRQRFHAQ